MNKFLTYSARAKMLSLAESWESEVVKLTASGGNIRSIEPLYESILDRATSYYATICDIPKVIIDVEALRGLSPNCIDFDYVTQEFVIQRESQP